MRGRGSNVTKGPSLKPVPLEEGLKSEKNTVLILFLALCVFLQFPQGRTLKTYFDVFDSETATEAEVDAWWRASTFDLGESLRSAIVANEHIHGAHEHAHEMDHGEEETAAAATHRQ